MAAATTSRAVARTNMSVRVYHSRRFVPAFEAETGPLDACLAWVRDEAPRPFLVLSHETDRHAHEVVYAPAKLYADLDVALDVPDGEAACDALAAALAAAVEAQFQVRADVLVLDASRPGEKLSRHHCDVADVASPASAVLFNSVVASPSIDAECVRYFIDWQIVNTGRSAVRAAVVVVVVARHTHATTRRRRSSSLATIYVA